MAGITEESMMRMGVGAAEEAIRVLDNRLPVNLRNPEVLASVSQAVSGGGRVAGASAGRAQNLTSRAIRNDAASARGRRDGRAAICYRLGDPAFRDGTAAFAQDSCSCKNLESLQQELKNAIYEAGFFESLSQRLDVIEKKQIEINKDPTNSESGKLVLQVSATARKDIIAKEFRLPHPAVTGYTGPEAVDMEARQVARRTQADLEAMRKGSPCKEIADITLQHESNAPRLFAKTMGADAYWARLPSEIAAEEAERYKAQADAMRGQLKRVIDEGTLDGRGDHGAACVPGRNSTSPTPTSRRRSS